MEFISKINDQIYFGKYPDKDVLKALQDIGIKVIVDLTHFTDNLPSYTLFEGVKRIEFPIVDRGIEDDEITLQFIQSLKDHILNDNYPIYIHCKGGHGRSGTVCCILYGILYNKGIDEAINTIKKSHNDRVVIPRKVRLSSSSQTDIQQDQIVRLLSNMV
jgi:protein-tyrosine phosphatase